jgi:hypothetical protein
MPCVRISTGNWAVGSEAKLIDAVQSAFVAAFKIPDSGATSGGHWCGRRANDIDARDDASGEGYFTFGASCRPVSR